MDIKYEDYLEAGTKELMEFLSSSDVDDEERNSIISAFTSELSDNIGDTGKLKNYETLIYAASIKYIDNKISKVLSASNASNSDYEKAIRLCERGREISRIFAINKWDLPELSNSELDKCEETLREHQESASIITKIIEEDRRIDELMKNAQIELSIEMCDIVLGLINELANDIAICMKKRIPIPVINNEDTKKVAKKMADLRKIAEQKEDLYQEILNIDLQIHGIVMLSQTLPEQWQEVNVLCQKQIELLTECNKKHWSLPSIRYSVPGDLVNQYKHFQTMNSLDKVISSNSGMLSSSKQYEVLLSNCAQQQKNIEICHKNNWEVPNLLITDPNGLARAIQEEKNKEDKAKRIKKNLILTGISAVTILMFVLFCIYKYRAGRVRIPFDASYVSGENLDVIYNELKNAGFENIQKKQDLSGWQDSNVVLSVTIDNQDSYNKGLYIKPDVSAVITYSSSGRVYVTDLLAGWKNNDYQTIVDILRKKGFTNIDIEEVDTADRTKDQQISSLVLNGEDYTNEYCYLPKNAPIIISYYTLKIGIGNDSTEFIGQDYENVVNSLTESGFTNVQTEKINTGWAKGNTVIGVTVNNVDIYNSDESFSPDVKIVVKYSSDDRTNATQIFENWNTNNYEELQTNLKNKGFTNVTVKEKITDDKSINHLVNKVTISNGEFKSGDCYIQKSAEIVIEYYILTITIGEDSSSFMSNTEGKYSSVVTELRNMGFTNIQVLRKNDLFTGWKTKEGSIASISINENSSFSETDTFRFDDPIVIVVHTFKNRGCDDITEIEE